MKAAWLLLCGWLACAGTASAWVVDDHEVCDRSRLDIASNITVTAGGLLDLRGCVLALRAPAYEDRALSMTDEGLVVRIEAGGELRMTALPGRPAGLERADVRYGYTIKAVGNVTSVGRPDAPNFIRGLEGNDQGALALGGFASWGNVEARWTTWSGNTGPGLYLASGASLVAEHVAFEGQGVLHVVSATATIRELDVRTPYTGLVASRGARVDVSGCAIEAETIGVAAKASEVRLDDCVITAKGTAVEALSSALEVVDSVLEANGTVLGARPEARFGETSQLVLRDVAVRHPGPGPAIAVTGSNMSVTRLDAREARGVAVDARESAVTVEGAHVAQMHALRITNPGALRIVEVEGPFPAARIDRTIGVTVVSAQRSAHPGAVVRLGNLSSQTDSSGQARLTWMWFDATEVGALPDRPAVVVAVEADGRTWSETLPRHVTAAVLVAPVASTGTPWLMALVGVGLGATAGWLVHRIRLAGRAGPRASRRTGHNRARRY